MRPEQAGWELGVKVYGMTEIARALGVDPGLVAKWRDRGKLPVADAELALGPVWLAETIEPVLESGGPDRKPPGRRSRGVYMVRARVKVSRFPSVDEAGRGRFNEAMMGGYNRWLAEPGVNWEQHDQAVVWMPVTATDEAEAVDMVKTMIMRRANNLAQVALDEVERLSVERLGDW